ncbi:MAG TPA: S-layer homology domain-containing protein [Bacillota bacterium]|nr:S-layer homology domain-containing protein [Bacillota bacterium]
MASKKLIIGAALAFAIILSVASIPTSGFAAGAAAPKALSVPKAELSDIDGHWAEGAINTLVKMGVIAGYPDGTFRPEEPVTRAELSKIVARTFGYAPTVDTKFSDMEGHWAEPFVSALDTAEVVTGYPDGTFRPAQNVSRAELAAILSRVAQLGKVGVADASSWTPTYRDVDSTHWAFRHVEVARRLDIIPIHFGLVFEPDRPATRAETAHMVKSLAESEFARGTVAQVNKSAETLSLRNAAGNTQTIQIDPETIVYRNGVASDLESIRENDSVYAVGTGYGATRFVMAEGAVTREDITRKVSALTDGIITPEQVDAISRGKWDEARNGMSPALAQRLVEMGLTEEEAQALLAEEWDALPELAQRRLAMALSEEIGVSPELIESIMNRDWKSARSYAELEVAELLLSRFLNM